MGMMALVGDATPRGVVLPGFIVAMIGTGMFNPAVQRRALLGPSEQSGLAAGVNDTFRQAGIAVGVAALGALVPAEAALGGGPAEYVDGLNEALSPARAAAVGAVAAVALIGRGQFAGESAAARWSQPAAACNRGPSPAARGGAQRAPGRTSPAS